LCVNSCTKLLSGDKREGSVHGEAGGRVSGWAGRDGQKNGGAHLAPTSSITDWLHHQMADIFMFHGSAELHIN